MEVCQLRRQNGDTRNFTQSLIDFLDSTGGRDKLFRVIQYIAKFILPLLKSKTQLSQLAVFVESLGSSMGLVRKVIKDLKI